MTVDMSAAAPARTSSGIKRLLLGGPNLSNARFGMLCVAPAALVLLVTVVIPIATVIKMSFEQGSLLEPETRGDFVGLSNYVTALSDSDFIGSLGRLAVYSLGSVAGAFILGFTLALAVNQGFRAMRLTRGLFLLPWILPSSAVTLLWLYLFNPQSGMINHVLSALGLVEPNTVWLQDFDRAMPAVIMTNIWRGFPFHFLVLLAALQTIPATYQEAAMLDGANAVQRFWHVTLPFLRPIIALDLVLATIWQTQSIVSIAILTQGGPGQQTNIATYYLYEEAFQRFDFGTAAAMGVMVMVILAVASVLFLRFFNRNEELH